MAAPSEKTASSFASETQKQRQLGWSGTTAVEEHMEGAYLEEVVAATAAEA